MGISAKLVVLSGILLSLLSSAVASSKEATLSWDYVMSREWKQPAKLDSFAGVHPRYLLNKEKAAELRKKIKTTHKKLWEIVEERANSYTPKEPPANYKKQSRMRAAGRDIPWMALAYLMTGDSVHLDNAKRWILTICDYPHWDRGRSLGAGECLFGVAIGYDWLYDKLTEEERAHIRQRLVHHGELMKKSPQHRDRWLANHNHVENNGLAAAGFVLYGEAPQAAEWLRQAGLNFRQTFKSIGPDGASDEGHQYWTLSTESLLSYAEAARDLMGIDYYKDSDFMKNAADFIIFSTLPDIRPGDYVMAYGDSVRGYGGRNPVYILYRLASEYRNGYAQWLANTMVERGIGRNDYGTWRCLLWYDETVKPICISQLPTFRYFDNIGWVTMRSGWGADAVMAGFKCGPFHGHKIQPYYEKMTDLGIKFQKISGGHCHPDINSFQIYAYGKWLAIHPGYEKPKRTGSHNTILIDGAGQLGDTSVTGRDYGWFDREAVAAAKAKSTITKTETGVDYDYVIGDAGNIYPASTGLKKFYRHLLYIKPDVILVVDELEAVRPVQFEWRLHAEESVEKIDNNYCIVKTGDVVMDSHFVFPETIETKIDGKSLSVLPSKTDKTTIVSILHPRRIRDSHSEIRTSSFRDNQVVLVIKAGPKEITVRLDLAKQQVRELVTTEVSGLKEPL